jgi:hypothetical protein
MIGPGPGAVMPHVASVAYRNWPVNCFRGARRVRAVIFCEGLRGLREPTVRWSATRRGQRLSTAPPMIGESDSWMTQAGDARTLTGPVCSRWSVWSTGRRAAGG